MKIETIYLCKQEDINGNLRDKIYSSCLPNMVIPNVDLQAAAHLFFWFMRESDTDWKRILIGSDKAGDKNGRYLDVDGSMLLTRCATAQDFVSFEKDLTAAMKEHDNDTVQFIGGMVRYSDEMDSLLRHLEVTWFDGKIVVEVKTELQHDIMNNIYFFNTADVAEYEARLYHDILSATSKYVRS